MDNNMKECPDCGGTRFIEDINQGEVYCAKCGLVLEENKFDFTKQWIKSSPQFDTKSPHSDYSKHLKIIEKHEWWKISYIERPKIVEATFEEIFDNLELKKRLKPDKDTEEVYNILLKELKSKVNLYAKKGWLSGKFMKIRNVTLTSFYHFLILDEHEILGEIFNELEKIEKPNTEKIIEFNKKKYSQNGKIEEDDLKKLLDFQKDSHSNIDRLLLERKCIHKVIEDFEELYEKDMGCITNNLIYFSVKEMAEKAGKKYQKEKYIDPLTEQFLSPPYDKFISKLSGLFEDPKTLIWDLTKKNDPHSYAPDKRRKFIEMRKRHATKIFINGSLLFRDFINRLERNEMKSKRRGLLSVCCYLKSCEIAYNQFLGYYKLYQAFQYIDPLQLFKETVIIPKPKINWMKFTGKNKKPIDNKTFLKRLNEIETVFPQLKEKRISLEKVLAKI